MVRFVNESLGLQIIHVTGSVCTRSQSCRRHVCRLLVVFTFDDSRAVLVQRFSSRSWSPLLIFARCWTSSMYLEVVTYEGSRVELTPEVVRTCRYYLYIVWFSLSRWLIVFCLSWCLTASFVTVLFCDYLWAVCCGHVPVHVQVHVQCACSCAGAVTSPVQCTFRCLSMSVHVSILLRACACAGAGAWASACACAGAGVRLLQHSLRCLSAIIHVSPALFSPHRFFESYLLWVYGFFVCYFFLSCYFFYFFFNFFF